MLIWFFQIGECTIYLHYSNITRLHKRKSLYVDRSIQVFKIFKNVFRITLTSCLFLVLVGFVVHDSVVVGWTFCAGIDDRRNSHMCLVCTKLLLHRTILIIHSFMFVPLPLFCVRTPILLDNDNHIYCSVKSIFDPVRPIISNQSSYRDSSESFHFDLHCHQFVR